MEVEATQSRAIPPGINCTENRLLSVRDLNVIISSDAGRDFHLLRNVSFKVGPAEIVGLLGESGAGKTTTALSLMQMLPSVARVEARELRFDGFNLLELREHELCSLRGSEISIIFQDSNVLNPVMRAGDQVIEVLRAHRQGTKSQMKEEVIGLFHALGLDDGDRIFRAYPHQLSGGQRRRITIAQALICKPRLVIADEPTAWLDLGRTAEIMALITRLRDTLGTAFLLISHDPQALATAADRAMVMYAGQIVESGPAAEVFNRPMHPYTRALLQCASRSVVQENGARRTLPFIPGSAPDPSAEIRGCSFSERCKDRMDICGSTDPQLVAVSGDHSARCFLHGGVA